MDEKSQVQALDRTAPILPLRLQIPANQTYDYVRIGTTSLSMALEVATGKVVDRCYDRHTNVEFLAFRKPAVRTYPRRRLHAMCDNYTTHKHPNMQVWLAKRARVQLQFTPHSSSWLNMVEVFSGIITKQAIRHGTFGSVRDLTTAIRTYIDGWNERCRPFRWTEDADRSWPRPSVQLLRQADTRTRFSSSQVLTGGPARSLNVTSLSGSPSDRSLRTRRF